MLKYVNICLLVTLTGCFTGKDTSSNVDRKLIDDILRPVLDSIYYLPDDKKIGIYWNGRTLDGHYRKRFVDMGSDSFEIKNKLLRADVENLKRFIQDTLRFEFGNHERISGLNFLRELPDRDSVKKYFILEVSASQPVIHNDTGLIYIDAMDLFYHNGDGVICKLTRKNDKWTVKRVMRAWWMRMDTVRFSVVYMK